MTDHVSARETLSMLDHAISARRALLEAGQQLIQAQASLKHAGLAQEHHAALELLAQADQVHLSVNDYISQLEQDAPL